MRRYLQGLSGRHKGTKYPIIERLVLGRASSCDVVLKSGGTSRKHAILMSRQDGEVLIRDLASKNGTRVDGRVVRQLILHTGMKVRLGEEEFEYRDEEEELRTSACLPPGPLSAVSNKTTFEDAEEVTGRRSLLKLAKKLARGKK